MPKVTIVDTDQVVEILEDDLLFDALAAQEIKLPHGCLSGSCGACRIEVITPDALHPPGAVEQDTIDCLNDERKNAGMKPLNIRLSCRAKIKSDVTIKLIKD